MSIRNAAVAGAFYPANKAQLFRDVRNLLAADSFHDHRALESTFPKALILPHAGYIYSGPVAAEGYRLLGKYKDAINRVVILGPSHRVAFQGIALPQNDYFSTPLGSIPVDPEAVSQLQDMPFVFQSEDAHREEHSLEVHLPFLQVQLDNFSIIPLVVGDASPSQVAEVIEKYIGLPGVLVIISTDLSHFHGYQQAKDIDLRTSSQICSKYNQIRGEQACGCRPLNGLLALAAEYHLQVRELAVCNSGDTAGDKNRVVGYGAYVVY